MQKVTHYIYGYFHGTDDGYQYLSHRDDDWDWRVGVYSVKELELGVEVFYRAEKPIGKHMLNEICHFPYSGLTGLVLIQCEIDTLPAEIGELTDLTTLDLRSNPTTTLPAEIGQLGQLTELDLSNNQLTSRWCPVFHCIQNKNTIAGSCTPRRTGTYYPHVSYPPSIQ